MDKKRERLIEGTHIEKCEVPLQLYVPYVESTVSGTEYTRDRISDMAQLLHLVTLPRLLDVEDLTQARTTTSNAHH